MNALPLREIAISVPAPPIKATAYQWKDPATIPPREWLYGRHLIRQFASALIAPGAVGKTKFEVVEALAMVTGRDLLGIGHDREPLRVWLWNLEDPREEMDRQIQAAAQHYEITEADIGGRLFLDVGREQKLILAEQTRNGTTIRAPVSDQLIANIIGLQIDCVLVDPFVSSHSVSENDNSAIDTVAKEWGRIAGASNCAIGLAHQTRKAAAGDTEVTAESGRGAKALVDACRSVLVLNRMSEAEGMKAGIEFPRSYFRAYDDKNNLSPPAEVSEWYCIRNVPLANGDDVGVVTRWAWPDAMADVSPADVARAQAACSGKVWRENDQADAWVGKPIASALGIDIGSGKTKDLTSLQRANKAKVKRLLIIWLASGAFVRVEMRDRNGDMRPFIEVGDVSA